MIRKMGWVFGVWGISIEDRIISFLFAFRGRLFFGGFVPSWFRGFLSSIIVLSFVRLVYRFILFLVRVFATFHAYSY